MKSHFFFTLIISVSLFSIKANFRPTVDNSSPTTSTVSTVDKKKPIPTNKTKIASPSPTKAHDNVPTSPRKNGKRTSRNNSLA